MTSFLKGEESSNRQGKQKTKRIQIQFLFNRSHNDAKTFVDRSLPSKNLTGFSLSSYGREVATIPLGTDVDKII